MKMSNKKDEEYIIIIGGGTLGCHLADLLSLNGNSVVLIDKDEKAFNKLSENFSGFTLKKDASQIETLKEAKIERAGVVVAATSDDNLNAMISQIAKVIFSVPRVICRLYEPKKQMVYQDLDIETICPNILSANKFKDIITGEKERAL